MTPAEMETLLRTLDARTLRIEQILPTLATKAELGRVEDRLGHVEDGLANVESRLGRVEDRLGNVEDRLGRVEGRLGNVEDSLGRVDHRLDGVEGTQHRLLILMEDTRDDLRLLAEHVATALDRIQRHS